MSKTSVCKLCGDEFQARTSQCSMCDDCKKEIIRRWNTASNLNSHCIICGTKLSSFKNGSPTLFCSAKCRNLGYTALNDGWRIEEFEIRRADEAARRRRSESNRRIVQKEAEARKLGITYGEYVARLRNDGKGISH